ncbi:tumor necrosis factor receptor superfamily member 14-like isoform X2 [Heptranchias perlo]|uniref:tumor necrosis factor receptor superfamily member 14-like isoform X2 n=1 Tax=Heptranchias perlo TaxID=212740 RepID=UPI003559ED00
MAVIYLCLLMLPSGLVNAPLNVNPCSDKEYKYRGQCCPMCKPGQRVEEHCTHNTGTQCYPCANSTYRDNFNGLEQCIACKACGEGSYDIKACNITRNTICDCLDGFHCDKLISEGCEQCTKHSTCPAGEVMRRKGTYRQDTMCHPSPSGNDLATAKDSKTEPTPGCAPADTECSKYLTALTCVSALCVLIITTVVVFNFGKAKDLWNRLCSGDGVCSKETVTRSLLPRACDQVAFNKPVQEEGDEQRLSLPFSVQEESTDNSSTEPNFDLKAAMKEPSKKLCTMQHLDPEETIPMSSVKTI